MSDLRADLITTLAAFATQPLPAAARALFAALGYTSQRTLALSSVAQFRAQFDAAGRLSAADRTALGKLTALHFLFQLTDAELSTQNDLFTDPGVVDGTRIHSYLFFAAELPVGTYSRTDLTAIARALNKPLPMPALVLFKHGDTLSLAVLHRRLNKVASDRDVLEKATLIKDVRCAAPHRAHVEILADLAFDSLRSAHTVTNFVQLHAAWRETLDIQELNKRFYQQLQHWYFWALGHVRFPADAPKDAEGRDSLSLIRLLTRLIFVWFLKEKGLVPENLFDVRTLPKLLKDFAPDKLKAKDSVYYRAVLQNLFFATLNCEPKDRAWAREGQNMMAHSLYRHRDDFASAATALDLFKDIPFLNGGLFECFDKDLGEGVRPRYVRIDGFSRRDDSQPTVPDFLFFGPEQDADLSDFYEEKKAGKKSRPARVRGLISIFQDFKFTIEENTPLEEDVALDPELLGRVFENLLAAYNPETQVTARKQTGSFYTPREIVDYMTGQALFYALREKLAGTADLDDRLQSALAHDDVPNPFNAAETAKLIAAIDELKVLDPACGSGAFPMGVLHRLVHLLGKLDPGNKLWKQRQLDKVSEIPDPDVRTRLAADIEQAFATNELGYGRKLYLIENCLYGVDIQPIAAQITKLRFFISLVVEQRTDPAAPNRGIRPLPNLETKIVAANTLLGIARPGQQLLRNLDIDTKEAELRHVRDEHFLARTPKKKAKCREDDARLRKEIAALLKDDGWDSDTAKKLSAWDPYDQNAHADFFDNEWMFGLTEGFDVVIGNPPYVLLQAANRDEQLNDYFREHFKVAAYKLDLYHLFIERGVDLLSRKGAICFITPSNFVSNNYAVALRRFLLTETVLEKLVFFEDGVFDASVHNLVLLARRDQPAESVVSFNQAQIAMGAMDVREISKAKQSDLTNEKCLLVPRQNSAADSVIDRMNRTDQALGSIASVNFGMQLRDRSEYPADVIESPRSKASLTKFHRECYAGKDVHRFNVTYTNRYCFFSREAKRGGCWDEEVHSAKDKILVRQIGAYPVGGLDTRGFAVLNAAFMILPTSGHLTPKFLLGVLNSSCVRFYWLNKFQDDRKTFPKIKGEYLKLLPIPKADSSKQVSVLRLVDQILAAKRADAEADTSALEAEIDRHVYALYGLTPAEIKIVEGEAPATAQPALQPAAKGENWRATPLKRPLHTRQLLKERYQPAAVEELLAQASLPVSFEVFRRAYWFLSQPDRLATWAEGALPQFGAKEWRRGFGESLSAKTFFAHLKAMVQQGQIKLRTLDGEVCVVEAKLQPAGIAHVICDARLAILAAEARTSANVLPALSVAEQKELMSLASLS